jgi:hypothetical protein
MAPIMRKRHQRSVQPNRAIQDQDASSHLGGTGEVVEEPVDPTDPRLAVWSVLCVFEFLEESDLKTRRGLQPGVE